MSNQTKFDQIHEVTAGGQQTNFFKRAGTVLAPYIEAAIQRSAGFIVNALLDAPIQRQGLGKGIGNGVTNLRAFLAWNDDHVARTFNVAGEAATPEEVAAAVREGLESVTVASAPEPAQVEEVHEVKA
jgi:hypothetical protein